MEIPEPKVVAAEPAIEAAEVEEPEPVVEAAEVEEEAAPKLPQSEQDDIDFDENHDHKT